MKAQEQQKSEEQEQQKDTPVKEDVAKESLGRYGIDQMMADLSKESVEHMSERNER